MKFTRLFAAALVAMLTLSSLSMAATDGQTSVSVPDPTVGMNQIKSVDFTGRDMDTTLVLVYADGTKSECALYGSKCFAYFKIVVYEKAKGTYAKTTAAGGLLIVVRNHQTEDAWQRALTIALLNGVPMDVVPTVHGTAFR